MSIRIINKSRLGYAAALLSSLYCGQATSQTGAVKADLRPFLAEYDVSVTGVNKAIALVRSQEAEWMKGVNAKINPANFSLSGSGSSSSVKGILKVSYQGISLSPVSVQSCSLKGDSCKEVPLQKQGALLKGVAFDANWEFAVYGSPCLGSLSCEFSISSWALKSRLDNAQGEGESFPGVAAVIDFQGGLSIFDVERGKPWLTWKSNSGGVIEQLGQLSSASLFGNKGMLDLAFANGHLVLDFQSDRALVVRSDGIFEAEDGIANFDRSSLSSVLSIPPSINGNLGRVVAVYPNFIVWSKASVYFNPAGKMTLSEEAMTVGDYQQSFYDSSSETIHVMALEEGKIKAIQFDGSFFSSMKVAKTVNYDANKQYALIKSEIFTKGNDGLFLVGDSTKLEPTSLATRNGMLIYSEGGAFVETKDSTGEGCTWSHLVQNKDKPQSFRESGLVTACSNGMSFSAGNNWAAISDYDKGLLRVSIVRQN